MNKLGFLLFALCVLLAPGFAAAGSPAVKVATIHFGPTLGDVIGNRARLVALSEEAARNGAKIIVNTEMATSGYAFFSRAEIAKVAEPIPGPTTAALGSVAKAFQSYIVVGLPEFDGTTNQLFNSAALIGPDGEVKGVYRKRSTLVEASCNAIPSGPIPTFDTEYGRLAVVICADLFYPGIPRLAAVAGADILLVAANVGVDLSVLRLRATENDFALILANRYGTEGSGSKPDSFSEDTFAIPSPWPYDFKDSRSAVIAPGGEVLADLTDPKDAIAYANLPARAQQVFPAVRRPELYTLLSQDTLEPYTFKQLQLPDPALVAVAALDPGEGKRDVTGIKDSLDAAITSAKAKGLRLRLAVFSSRTFTELDATLKKNLEGIVIQTGVDLVVPFEGSGAPRKPFSLLIVADEAGGTKAFEYDRAHRLRNEPVDVGDDFLVVDRDYGRVGVLQGPDLLAPESTLVMEKMGVDIVAVSAAMSGNELSAVWRTRSADYLHIVVANSDGTEGIYLGGYIASPLEEESEGQVLMVANTGDVRNKKEPRHLDLTPLLVKCGLAAC